MPKACTKSCAVWPIWLSGCFMPSTSRIGRLIQGPQSAGPGHTPSLRPASTITSARISRASRRPRMASGAGLCCWLRTGRPCSQCLMMAAARGRSQAVRKRDSSPRRSKAARSTLRLRPARRPRPQSPRRPRQGAPDAGQDCWGGLTSSGCSTPAMRAQWSMVSSHCSAVTARSSRCVGRFFCSSAARRSAWESLAISGAPVPARSRAISIRLA